MKETYAYSLSPLQEVVLTALVELGLGATDIGLWQKARQLAKSDTLVLLRVRVALQFLERIGYVYSWPVESENESDPDELHRHYRLQYGGERALAAAAGRRGPRPLSDYFHWLHRYKYMWDWYCRNWG